MKMNYAEIEIRIKAEEDEINGPNEMALSDRVMEFQEKIEDAVEELRREFPEFLFNVTGG